MRGKATILVDVSMIILLMLLMAFERIGRTAHEWLGMGMLVLFVCHHGLNRRWYKQLLRGKYPPLRILQTVLAALVFLTMLGTFVSAVLISRRVFAFLPIRSGRALGRTLHMLCTDWGFVVLSLHLGFHWKAMLGRGKRSRRPGLPVLGACIALYGLYGLFHRGMPGYLFLRTPFVFFDFIEPLIFFFLDYLAIMGLFVWIGHYLAKGVGKLGKRCNSRRGVEG